MRWPPPKAARKRPKIRNRKRIGNSKPKKGKNPNAKGCQYGYAATAVAPAVPVTVAAVLTPTW